MDPEVELYMKEKQEKQDYLKDQIVDKGYNTVEFAQYLLENKGTWINYFMLTISLTHVIIENGTEIDNWTVDELKDAVLDFQSRYQVEDGKFVS